MDDGVSEKISDEDKLNTAKKLKQEGNDAHKDKNYKKAIGKYHRALLFLKGIGQMQVGSLFGMGDDKNKMDAMMVSEVTALKTSCYNNLAVCLLQNEKPDYKKIIQYCDIVLKDDQSNVKATFRKGKSQFCLKEYDNAITTFNKIPNEPESKQFIHRCKRELDKQYKNMQINLAGMFNSKQTNKCVGDN